MGILSSIGNVLGTIGKTVLGGLGSAVGSSITDAAGGALGNYLDEKAQMRVAEHGADLDRQSAIDQLSDRYKFYENRGATITEQLGLGHGSTAQGATATLGNSAAQLRASRSQQAAQARERALDRQTQLAQTAIQADAQVKSAQTSADASIYATDTTDKFNRDTIQLKVGLDNLISSSIAYRHGIDIEDPQSILALSESEFNDFIFDVLAATSTTGKEKSAWYQLYGYVVDYGEEWMAGAMRKAMNERGTFGMFEPGKAEPAGDGGTTSVLGSVKKSGKGGGTPLRLDAIPPAALGNQGISQNPGSYLP